MRASSAIVILWLVLSGLVAGFCLTEMLDDSAAPGSAYPEVQISSEPPHSGPILSIARMINMCLQFVIAVSIVMINQAMPWHIFYSYS